MTTCISCRVLTKTIDAHTLESAIALCARHEAVDELLEIVTALHDWYEQAGYNGNGPSGSALLFSDDSTLGTHIRAAFQKAGAQ